MIYCQCTHVDLYIKHRNRVRVIDLLLYSCFRNVIVMSRLLHSDVFPVYWLKVAILVILYAMAWALSSPNRQQILLLFEVFVNIVTFLSQTYCPSNTNTTFQSMSLFGSPSAVKLVVHVDPRTVSYTI